MPSAPASGWNGCRVRRKAQASPVQLRKELAQERDRLAESFVSLAPESRALGAGYAQHAQGIGDGAEVRACGWELPDWARGSSGMYQRVILGADDILRHDPDLPVLLIPALSCAL